MQIESLLTPVKGSEFGKLMCVIYHTSIIGTNSEEVPIRDSHSFLLHIVWDNSMCSSCFGCSERLECMENKA